MRQTYKNADRHVAFRNTAHLDYFNSNISLRDMKKG